MGRGYGGRFMRPGGRAGGLFGLASRFARGRIFAQTDAQEIEAPSTFAASDRDFCDRGSSEEQALLE